MSCEDVPCRKDVENPEMGISFFQKDSAGLSYVTADVKLDMFSLYGKSYTDTIFRNKFSLPILPDSNSVEIFFAYDTIIGVDTIVEFQQNVEMFYRTELVGISPECGFNFKYIIDSISYLGQYIDTVIIYNKEIIQFENTNDKKNSHINIYFSNRF